MGQMNYRSRGTLALCAAALMCACAGLAAAEPFQGRVELFVRSPKKTGGATVLAAGDRVRIEFAERDGRFDGYSVVDRAAGRVFLVSDRGRYYVELPLVQDGAVKEPCALEPTGNTAIVAGIRCDEYVVGKGALKVRVWAQREVSFADNVFPSLGKGIGDQGALLRCAAAALQSRGLTPLKMENGALAVEVTRLAPGRIDERVLAVPAGYRKKRFSEFKASGPRGGKR